MSLLSSWNRIVSCFGAECKLPFPRMGEASLVFIIRTDLPFRQPAQLPLQVPLSERRTIPRIYYYRTKHYRPEHLKRGHLEETSSAEGRGETLAENDKGQNFERSVETVVLERGNLFFSSIIVTMLTVIQSPR